MTTLIVGGVVALAVAGALSVLIKDKKAGTSSCGGDCSKCRGCH